MTLTRYEDLQQWFLNNQSDTDEGTDKTASHWTLYGGNYGEREVRLTSNTRINKPSESLAYLVQTIRSMNHPDGSKFRIQIYKPGANNNYTAQTYVQIFEGQQNAAATGQMAGVGSLPGAPAMTEQYIQERIDLAMLKRENEELKAQMNGPVSGWERFLGMLNENEQLNGAIAGLLMGLAQKNGIPAQLAPAPVNGHPSSDEETDEDPQTVFVNNIQNAAATLQTDPVTLSKRLNKLIQQNPEVAKQLLQA